MTFDAFVGTITASALTDWVRLVGTSPGRLVLVYRPDVGTTIEYGGPPKLDPRYQGGLATLSGKPILFAVDCLRDGRLVYQDVLRVAAPDSLLPIPRNAQGQIGGTRRDLARLLHGLAGHGGDFDAAWQAAGYQVAINDPLA